MRYGTILLIIGIFLTGILFAGCSLPQQRTAAEKTASVEMTISALISTEQVLRSSVTPTPSASPVPSKTPFPEPTLTFTATFGPSPTPTLGPEYFHGSLWYEPGYVSQYGLKYYGSEITTGCTAACVQMVLDFWHKYKGSYPTMGAQELIDQNVWQGQFDVHTGLNILDTEDDLQLMD